MNISPYRFQLSGKNEHSARVIFVIGNRSQEGLRNAFLKQILINEFEEFLARLAGIEPRRHLVRHIPKVVSPPLRRRFSGFGFAVGPREQQYEVDKQRYAVGRPRQKKRRSETTQTELSP